MSLTLIGAATRLEADSEFTPGRKRTLNVNLSGCGRGPTQRRFQPEIHRILRLAKPTLLLILTVDPIWFAWVRFAISSVWAFRFPTRARPPHRPDNKTRDFRLRGARVLHEPFRLLQPLWPRVA